MFSTRATRRRFVRAMLVITLIAVALASLPATSAAAAANCQFVFGFKTLHDLIPNVVGDCVTNQSYNANGDGVQQTTRGLLVWRKADNHTAFTNGFDTWLLSPQGIQQRQNNARFAWEADAAPPNVDLQLSSSYNVAARGAFSSLISAVVNARVPVRVANLSGSWGIFQVNQGHPIIYINSGLLTTDPADAAAVLVHEATHFQQYQTQSNFNEQTTAMCVYNEFHANLNDLTFWRDQFGPGGKQPPTNPFEQQVNGQLGLAESDLPALRSQTPCDRT